MWRMFAVMLLGLGLAASSISIAQSVIPLLRASEGATEKKLDSPRKGDDKLSSQQNADRGDGEASEFWTIFGSKLKITDSLLVVFTFSLFIATLLLWWTTRRLVKGAEETAERQLRAYVSVGATSPIPNSVDPGLPAFQIQIKNSGKTPAYCVKSWRGIGIHELPLVNELKPKDTVTETDVVLGAGSDFILPIRRQNPFRPQDVAGVQAGTHAIYVFGRVEYQDAFEKPRYTNFCLYQADGGGGAGLKHSARGNDAN